MRESYTTLEMITTAKIIASEITHKGKQFGISECIVDDYGRYGNFSLICYLDVEKTYRRSYKPRRSLHFNLKKIVNVIKRVCKEYKKDGAILRGHESPSGVYTSNSVNGMRLPSDFSGYDRSYISIDLDFIPYHEATNTFAVQKVIGSDERQRGDNQLALGL